MKTRILSSYGKKLLAVTALLIVAETVFTYSSGPPAGHSGAPGDDNCTACHGGSPITSGSIWSDITLTRNGTGGLSGALPNAANSMTLSVSSSTNSTFGFQLCVLPGSASASSASVGTLSGGTSSIVQGTSISSPARNYIMHTASGNYWSSGTATWNFNWVTPSSFTGGATFYVAVNVADGDQTNSGDDIYVKSFSATVLPVRWLDFNASASELGVRLKFSTAMEINNDKFVIERSPDGDVFDAVGEVKGVGNSQKPTHYSFLDEAYPKSRVFYRIRQTDQDGVIEYSKIISFEPDRLTSPQVAIAGTGHALQVSHTVPLSGIRILSLNGSVVSSQVGNSSGLYPLENLPNGIYLVELQSADGNNWLKKFIMQ